MFNDLLAYVASEHRRALRGIVAASVLLNLIVFSGSIYMMLVYDSVLPSHSIPTLIGLFLMLVLLYAFQMLFEQLRSRSLMNVANSIHRRLAPRIRRAMVDRSLTAPAGASDGLQPIRDLDQLHGFLMGSGPLAFIDLPWVLVFMVVLFTLHWALGLTALAGVVVLAAIAVLTDRRTVDGTRELGPLASARMGTSEQTLRTAQTALALGMTDRMQARASNFDARYLESQAVLSMSIARLGGAGRMFRIFLQSLILTVGALLVIAGQASGGVILASSVLSGRALAPVDQLLANWRAYNTARAGWARTKELLLKHEPAAEPSVLLPAPSRKLAAQNLFVAPPGATEFALRGVGFTLSAGDGLGIIGPSAAGKSTLARALAGIWPAQRGDIRLDGATYQQWSRESLGRSIGYLGQDVSMFEGTIGQNISRFAPDATPEAILAAAHAAGLHDMIVALESGYETLIGNADGRLSAGQRQRLGLARALYGDPFLLILDEPNSNLDAAGDGALAQAMFSARKRGAIVIMVTHRVSTIAPLSHLLMLQGGHVEAFGERDEVLRRVTKPAKRPAPQNGTDGSAAKGIVAS